MRIRKGMPEYPMGVIVIARLARDQRERGTGLGGSAHERCANQMCVRGRYDWRSRSFRPCDRCRSVQLLRAFSIL